MCYADTYACTVTCINSALNRTRLSEGVVISDAPFNGCRITCAEAVHETSSGWATTVPIHQGAAALFELTPLKVFVIMMILIAAVILWIYHIKKEGN